MEPPAALTSPTTVRSVVDFPAPFAPITDLNLRIQIPVIGVDTELMAGPETEMTWNVEWLQDQAGLLDGTALPGEGISIIAAHNTLNAEKTGPFFRLSALQKNDTVLISGADGSVQIFRKNSESPDRADW